MAGILFIVNVPNKEYEKHLKEISIPNSIFEKEKYENASKVIHELKEKQLENNLSSLVHDGVGTKCQSTECLDQRAESDLYKCNSETTLKVGLESDRSSYAKASWEEIKQVIKQKKNKLKINRPVRGVDVLGAFGSDTPLETILSEIVLQLGIKNAAWNSTSGDTFWQVIFSLESGTLSEELLQVLRTLGIGSRYQSSVSLLPCALYYKSNERIQTYDEVNNAEYAGHESESKTAWSRFSSSVRARTNLAQVVHDVRANGAITFDWVFMLLVAAFVATIGLIENSTVILVASMLISPLMGPITAGTLGTVVRDRSLQMMGVKNEFLGLFLSLVMGFLVGLTICAVDERYGVIEDWPTEEMLARCAHRSLWIGILVAIPSGAGCALAVLGDYTASLVGVAISASLLPPAVNAGLLWSMALTRLLVKAEEHRWLVVQPSELALLGTASLCLTLVNIVCIFLSGVAVYKVKEVSPLDRRDIPWWKLNRNRVDASEHQNNENPLNWDAYNKWRTASFRLSRREVAKKADDERAPNESSVVNKGTSTFRQPSSIIRQLRTRNSDSFIPNIQLEGNYIQRNSDMYVDLEKEIQELARNNEVQKLSKENQKNKAPLNENDTDHGYYNMVYNDDDLKENSNLPTIDTIYDSPSVTVDNCKNGLKESGA